MKMLYVLPGKNNVEIEMPDWFYPFWHRLSPHIKIKVKKNQFRGQRATIIYVDDIGKLDR